MPTPDRRGTIRALKKQERDYRETLRQVVDVPILTGFAASLSEATEMATALEMGVVGARENITKYLAGTGTATITNHFITLSAEHRQIFIDKFSRLITVDVQSLLTTGPIAQVLDKRIDVNVNLIKLIEREHLPKVAEGVKAALKDQPFDRATLTNYFRREWGVQGLSAPKDCAGSGK